MKESCGEDKWKNIVHVHCTHFNFDIETIVYYDCVARSGIFLTNLENKLSSKTLNHKENKAKENGKHCIYVSMYA